jgi:hypothetical protein
MPGQPDFAHLFGLLASSKTQQSNNALYETIFLLIRSTEQARDALVVNDNDSGNTLSQLLGVTYLTVDDETALLINSRRLLAGTNVTFNDAIAGQRTINVSASAIAGKGYWTPLTDGDPDETDLIFANGEAIAVFVPT